jgi:hypothetical protein
MIAACGAGGSAPPNVPTERATVAIDSTPANAPIQANASVLAAARELADCLDKTRPEAQSCEPDYADAVRRLAHEFGERAVVETFLAVHADRAEVGKTYANALYAMLHVFVSPLGGPPERARACATALLATDRRFAEALLDLAEEPAADRELGPLAACVGERHGLFPRVRRLVKTHPNVDLRDWLISTLGRAYPRSAEVAALLREALSDESTRKPALEALTKLEEPDPKATCDALLALSRDALEPAEASFVVPDGKCAPRLADYLEKGVFNSERVSLRLEELCTTHAKDAAFAPQRKAFGAYANAHANDDTWHRPAAIRAACACDLAGAAEHIKVWRRDPALEVPLRRCK